MRQLINTHRRQWPDIYGLRFTTKNSAHPRTNLSPIQRMVQGNKPCKKYTKSDTVLALNHSNLLLKHFKIAIFWS